MAMKIFQYACAPKGWSFTMLLVIMVYRVKMKSSSADSKLYYVINMSVDRGHVNKQNCSFSHLFIYQKIDDTASNVTVYISVVDLPWRASVYVTLGFGWLRHCEYFITCNCIIKIPASTKTKTHDIKYQHVIWEMFSFIMKLIPKYQSEVFGTMRGVVT